MSLIFEIFIRMFLDFKSLHEEIIFDSKSNKFIQYLEEVVNIKPSLNDIKKPSSQSQRSDDDRDNDKNRQYNLVDAVDPLSETNKVATSEVGQVHGDLSHKLDSSNTRIYKKSDINRIFRGNV